MVTLFFSSIAQYVPLEILGWILFALEFMLVLIKFLQYFVDPESKFGHFLAKALKGFKFLKSEFSSEDEDKSDSEEE